MDKELELLIQKVKRQEKLEAMLGDLRAREREFAGRELELRECCLKEQADVDKLENHSIIAYFQSIAGTRKEKLDKERREALEALAKHKLVLTELGDIRNHIRYYEEEMEQLKGCRELYETRIAEKREILRGTESAGGRELLALENQLAEIKSYQKELQEAMEAGTRALATVGEVQASLNTAKSWSTYDMLGGSLIADVVKHNHMDKAQKLLDELQLQLGRFRTELSDVYIQSNLKVNVDGFERYADIFLDNFFTDWEIYDRIQRSQKEVDAIRERVSDVISKLKGMKLSALDQEKQVQGKIETLIAQNADFA